MCTGIKLTAQNNGIIYGRTLEFAQEIDSQIIIIPRNVAFQATAPSGKPEGLSWKSSYAVVGANASQAMHLVDGINECGLAGGLFYFPDYAEYQEVPSDQIQHSMAPWEIMTWLLTNFSSVAEVKTALPTIYVSNTKFQAWGIIPPLHAIVHDPLGNSLVIEYTHGQLRLYDNALGTITNSPTFDWHSTNVKNYINLSAFNAKKIIINNQFFSPLGQGSGMHGLPGDFTSPSRFIRATAFSQAVALNLKNEIDARKVAFHILNLFDIPRGIIAQEENGTILYEYTQWTSASDLHNRHYYFHTYENQQVYKIDLMNMNLNAEKITVVPMKYSEKIVDLL